EFYKRIDFSGDNITHGGFFFGDGVFKSSKILFEGGVDPIVRGFMNTPVKRPHRMTPAITEKMFGSTDLGSLNIQRGRDHAIPSYNTMRTFCGLPKAESFEDFSDMILDRNLRIGLSRNYNTTDDVDFYVGSMLEDPVLGGLVGTTLSCVIGEQFKRLRDGDRFYYENHGVFTPSQLAEIRKSSLSRVICDNGDHFELISQEQINRCNSGRLPAAGPTINAVQPTARGGPDEVEAAVVPRSDTVRSCIIQSQSRSQLRQHSTLCCAHEFVVGTSVAGVSPCTIVDPRSLLAAASSQLRHA
ncbi:heme peroxidase, partial [Ancylostoma caninum]